MKKIMLIIAAFALTGAVVNAQVTIDAKPAATKEKAEKKAKKTNVEGETMLVDVSCGQCQFGLQGQGCDLAVRIDGKSYYVDGKKMADYGDAHAHDGMCMTVRKANVQGEVVDDRFVATKLELLTANGDVAK